MRQRIKAPLIIAHKAKSRMPGIKKEEKEEAAQDEVVEEREKYKRDKRNCCGKHQIAASCGNCVLNRKEGCEKKKSNLFSLE